MTTELIKEELKQLFRNGCTLGQLLSAAREYLGQGAFRHEYVDLVRSTFDIHSGGWGIVGETESFGTGTRPDRVLDLIYLSEIIRKLEKWDNDDSLQKWYDGLKKSSSNEIVPIVEKRLKQLDFSALYDNDRLKVQNLVAQNLSLSEDLTILAALAEQLQRRVNELEQKLQPARAGAA